MSNNEQAFSMDSILDGTLDDLADLPEFKPFPVGTHKASIKIEQKMINKHPSFEIKFKAIETIEQPAGAKPEDVVTKDQEASVAYMMDNEIGQGKFKNMLASLSEHYGKMSNRDLIAAAQNAEVLIVVAHRQNKEKTQTYMDIEALSVV